jgi:hypothetical protein
MTTKSEKILATIDHLYWFYNADMQDLKNQKDFKKTIKHLIRLITTDDSWQVDPT